MKTLPMILMIVFTLPVHAHETNYAHYTESWEEWDELIEKYSHNLDIQMLHTVRIWLLKRLKRDINSFYSKRKTFARLSFR